MGGGVIIGVLWGVIVSGLVLTAVSLSTPLPPNPDAIPEVMEQSEAAIEAPEETSDADAIVSAADTPEAAPEVPDVVIETPDAPAPAPVPESAEADTADDTAFETAPAPSPSIADAPAAPVAPSDDTASRLPQVTAVPEAVLTPTDTPTRIVVPEASAAPEDTDVAAPRALPQIAPPPPETVTEANLPETPDPIMPGEAQGSTPAQEDETPPARLPQTPAFPQVVAPEPVEDSVTEDPTPVPEPVEDTSVAEAVEPPFVAPVAPPLTSRLPQIVAEEPEAAETAEPETARVEEDEEETAPASRLPQIAATPEAPQRLPQVTSDMPSTGDSTEDDTATIETPEVGATPVGPNALRDNAVPFDGDADRPLLAIVLIDDPESAMEMDLLTRFTFPVAFAVDPTQPDAATRAEAYRDAGFEVVIYGDIFPEGATPADAETALAAAQDVLPGAVAFLDTIDSRVQADRPILDATVAVLAETGHGVLAFPRGLNAAEQTARRESIPTETLFRLLDDEDQRATVITRFLTRAAFAATSEGVAVVAGRTRPDTVTALFSWALGSRSEGVAIAPLSAALLRGAE